MFKTKELLDLTLFNKMRIALKLDWTKGSLGAGIILDGSLTNFACHIIVLKVCFSLHIKWADLDCPTC